jgi:excisionase family DNA binding protein
MTTGAVQREYLTPPETARLLGVDPAKVIFWIRSGELRASDLATRRAGRPRYRIARTDIEAFLTRRSVVPAPKIARPRRRKDMTVIEFF